MQLEGCTRPEAEAVLFLRYGSPTGAPTAAPTTGFGRRERGGDRVITVELP
jgi:hypothetical protein